MLEILNLIDNSIKNNSFISMIISNNKINKEIEYTKINIDPVLIREEIQYHFTFYFKNKVEHKNIKIEELNDKITEIINQGFKQVMIYSTEKDYQILISKKNKIRTIEQNPSRQKIIFLIIEKNNIYLMTILPMTF